MTTNLIPQLTDTNINDKLSRLCSALLQNHFHTAAAFDDLRLFGAPTECGSIINRAHQSRMAEALEMLGLEAYEAHQLLVSRVDARWLHFVGCDIDNDIAEMAEADDTMRWDWKNNNWLYWPFGC